MAPRKRKGVGNDRSIVKKQKKSPSAFNESIENENPGSYSAAATAVFNTHELVEGILLHLPMRDVFAAQRVNREFRQVVQDSPRVQTKLFLRPSGFVPPTCVFSWHLPKYTGLWEKSIVRADDASDVDEKLKCCPVRLNPMLCRVPHDTRVGFNLKKSIRASSSFLKTFLTDPPCQKATMSFAWKVGNYIPFGGALRSYQNFPSVSDSKGVTLESLLLAVWQKPAGAVYSKSVLRKIGVTAECTFGDALATLERIPAQTR